MAALPNLVTVAQFRDLPEEGEYAYELHHGEVVALTRPKMGHSKIQLRLMELLAPKLRTFGVVTMEFPYRPLAEFEYRVADVVAVSRSRWDAIQPDENFVGAPDLVIEVKSPSNTKRQLQELVALCLANGSFECWIVDPEHSSVTVTRRDGSTVVYSSGQDIPLAAFGSDHLPVAAIFEALIERR